MSSFGKGQEVKEGQEIKRFTGVENFKVIAVNPTKEEIEEIYGREINYEPDYIGEMMVNDSDGEREAKQVRLDFYLQNEPKEGEPSISTKLSYYLVNTHHKSQTGKIKVINDFGRTTWLSEEDIKGKTLPSNMQWYNDSGIKVAKRGEEELIDFIVNLLNLPFDLSKLEDKSDAHAKFSKEDIQNIFSGDYSLLKTIIESTNNKIGVVLGVKTKADGNLTQSVFNRKTLRQYVLGSSKTEKFKYIQKDLEEAKANGAFGNVDFGPADLELREHKVVPTQLSLDNVSDEDIFSGPTTDNSGDEEDWMA